MHPKENEFQTTRASPFPKIDRHAYLVAGIQSSTNDPNSARPSSVCLHWRARRRFPEPKSLWWVYLSPERAPIMPATIRPEAVAILMFAASAVVVAAIALTF
jgi:hypothetical protein